MTASRLPQFSEPTISVSFTELLYGVVIGAALQRIKLDLSQENILLVLSLIIITQDFFFYHLAISAKPPSNQPLLFLLDMLVLGAWYPLSLAQDIFTFLSCLTIFFLIVSIWESLFGRSRPFRSHHVPVFIITLLVAGLVYLNLPDFSKWYHLAFVLTVFFFRRLNFYNKRYRPKPHT